MTRHIVYQLTHKDTGRYYRGKTSMARWENGYMGSGALIRKAVRKFGRDAFDRQILSVWDTEAEAYQAEHEAIVITADDPLSYNKKNHAPIERNYMTGKNGVLSPRFGEKHNPDSIAKMRGENNCKFGKSMPQHIRDKISKTKQGERHTQEHTDKARASYRANRESRQWTVVQRLMWGNDINPTAPSAA